MQILFLTNSEQNFEHFRRPAFEGLSRLCKVKVITGASNTENESNYDSLRIPRASLNILVYLRAAIKLRQKLIACASRNLFVFTSQMILIAFLARVFLRQRVQIVSTFSGFGYVSNISVLHTIYFVFLRFLKNPDDRFVCHNRDDCYQLHRLSGIPMSQIYLTNGSGLRNRCLKISIGRSISETKLIFVGRLIESKGLQSAVAAYRYLKKKYSDIQLIVYGSPDKNNPQSIKNLDNIRRLHPDITFKGHVADVFGFVCENDVLLFPSKREGCSKSVLEALSKGILVVANDVIGIRGIIDNGNNGLLASDGSQDDFNNKAEQAVELIRTRGFNPHQIAAYQTFGKDNFFDDQISEIYRLLLK